VTVDPTDPLGEGPRDRRGLLRRRGLLLGSYLAVALALVYIVRAFNEERTFRLDVRGLVRTPAYAEAPFESFSALQAHVRELGEEQGWEVVPRREGPLEVRTTWLGDRALRVLLDEWRVAPGDG